MLLSLLYQPLKWNKKSGEIRTRSLIQYWSNLAEKKAEKRKINEGGACRLIRNDVSVNRHINFQSVFFHFFSFLLLLFSIHDIYLFSVRCRSAGARFFALLLEHERIFALKIVMCCVYEREGEENCRGTRNEKKKRRKKENEKGPIGKS
jgi:hypothetical protein